MEESLGEGNGRDSSTAYSYAPPPLTTVPASEYSGRNGKEKSGQLINIDFLQK